MNILMMGGPGAGKGSMSMRLVSELNMIHISTGDIFRSEIRSQSELGKLAKQYIDQGLLVPDDVVNNMVESYLQKQDISNGYLLDGYPRTLQQAKAFDKMCVNTPRAIDIVIVLDIAVEALAERVSGRRICQECGSIYHIHAQPPLKEGVCDECGGKIYQRADDTLASLKIRLNEYQEQTIAVLEYYEQQGIVTHIRADQQIDNVWRDIKAVVQ